MKIKLNTGVIITQNKKGKITDVYSPYYPNEMKISKFKKLLNLWK